MMPDNARRQRQRTYEESYRPWNRGSETDFSAPTVSSRRKADSLLPLQRTDLRDAAIAHRHMSPIGLSHYSLLKCLWLFIFREITLI
jgi:hypothetical protein